MQIYMEVDKYGETLAKDPDQSLPSLLVTINALFSKLEASIGHPHEIYKVCYHKLLGLANLCLTLYSPTHLSNILFNLWIKTVFFFFGKMNGNCFCYNFLFECDFGFLKYNAFAEWIFCFRGWEQHILPSLWQISWDQWGAVKVNILWSKRFDQYDLSKSWQTWFLLIPPCKYGPLSFLSIFCEKSFIKICA